MNNKGFMMAEVVVVAAMVMMTLSTLYVSYGKLYSTYKTRLNYYDVNTLYALGYYRDTTDLSGMYTTASSSPYVLDTDASGNKVLLIYNHMDNLNSTINFGNAINPTYIDYVKYVSSAVDLTNTDYVLLMERCLTEDKCKYAYLEVG